MGRGTDQSDLRSIGVGSDQQEGQNKKPKSRRSAKSNANKVSNGVGGRVSPMEGRVNGSPPRGSNSIDPPPLTPTYSFILRTSSMNAKEKDGGKTRAENGGGGGGVITPPHSCPKCRTSIIPPMPKRWKIQKYFLLFCENM